jgi:nitrogen fixation protein FixH
MHMHWGHKITIVILLFLVSLGTMVWYAMQQTNEMVDSQYYQQELAYQQVIDAQHNLNAVTSNKIITQTSDGLHVQLPTGTFETLNSGTIELMRPDDSGKDIHIDMQSADQGKTLIAAANVTKGVYNARLRWENGGTPFYKEEIVFVR